MNQAKSMIAEAAASVKKDDGAFEVKVGSDTYTLYALPTSVGYSTAQQLVSLILPSAGAGVDGWVNSGNFEDSITFSSAASLLVKQMNEVDTLQIIRVLLNKAECNDRVIDFETHFRANYGTLVDLVEAAIAENFTSFFTHTGLKQKLADFLMLLANKGAQEEEEQNSPE